jgi:two-component system phosphate regulon response regulator PhoB
MATDKTTLWIEDDEFLSGLVSQKMAHEGRKLIRASRADEALAAIEAEIPDVVILDILLPGTNGFELLKQLREDARLAAVPIIVLSNYSQEDDIARAKSLGADRYLVKATLSLDDVMKNLDAVLSEGRAPKA